MEHNRLAFLLSLTLVLLSPALVSGQKTFVSLNVENAATGQTIPSTMHGMILETNINRDDDGGLYAELIYNRAFQEKGRSLDGWTTFGNVSLSLSNEQPLSSALPVHAKLSLGVSTTSISGVRNSGFYGMNLQASNYSASFYYRTSTNASVAGGQITIGFADANGMTTYGTAIIDVFKVPPEMWFHFQALIPVAIAAPTTKNVFFIQFPAGSRGDFEFNLISCFPPTFNGRLNGARPDIAQAFADLKPGYVRIPGGNDLEGPSISERFIWNNTVGLLENRPGRRGTWTGYNTEGFGLIELLTFVEDIGATPVLAVYAGYSLDRRAVPESDLQPYVDEVVKQLDFLMAPADTNPMGALRAKLGRSQPFDIKFVEIGNEDFISPAPLTYGYRWAAFYNALSQRYPQITYIATTTKGIPTPPAVDDHDYQMPQFFIDNFRRYEKIPRPGPKVLVGEFSVIADEDAQGNNSSVMGRLKFPTMRAAVAESIYRIGFERNSDVIIGGCYAPVLQNIDDTQWTPNLIVFNAGQVVRSTSFLAQQIFGQHLGNIILNSTASNGSFTHQSVRRGEEGDGKIGNLYFVASKLIADEKLIVKFANVDQNDIVVQVTTQGSMAWASGIASIVSAGPGVDPGKAQNTFDNPNAVSIRNVAILTKNGQWNITIPSWSVVVAIAPL